MFINITPIQNYSGSLINVKINMSNAMSQITDRVIVLTAPVRFVITGSRVGAVGTPNLLADGEFGVASNSFTKCINVGTINIGTAASYSLQTDSGIIINALEASAPMFYPMQQLNNIDNQMYDNCANYDDLLYTNRNVLGLYSNNAGTTLGRCAYDIVVEANTPTSATLLVTFRFALFVSPLLQDIHVNGGQAGLSHIDSMTFNLALTNLNTRLLKFARNTNNGRIVISSIVPQFGPNFATPNPSLEWSTYNIISAQFELPAQVNYPLPILDRYPSLITVPYNGSQALFFSTPTVSLNSVPSYVLLFATYPENLYQSENIQGGPIPSGQQVHGCQLTDAFAPIFTVSAQVNSVNQMNNSTQITLWKSYIKNGGNKTFVEWSGLPVLKTVLDPVAANGVVTMYPSAGPVKLNFGTDLHVRSPSGTSLSPGTNFKFNVNFRVSIKNTLPYSDTLVLYAVFVYPSVLCLSGVNNSQIVNQPLSVEDCMSLSDKNPTGHFGSLNTHDLVGFGLNGMLHKLMTHPRMASKMRKHRMHRHLLKEIASHLPVSAEHGSGSTGGRGRKAALRL